MATWKKVVTESASAAGTISQTASGITGVTLGSLATLSTVNAATITDNSVGAAELNVSGNGTAGQALTSDADGTFSWSTISASNLALTNFAGSAITTSSESFADNDLLLMTSAAINDRILAISSNNSGTVTNVTVGTGLDVSNSSSTPAITLDLSELADGSADVVGSADKLIYLDNGTQKSKHINDIKLGQFNNDQGWTSNSGDITGVVAGTGLTGGATSGSATLNVGAGTGVTVGANSISIGQAVGTTDNVTFNNVHIDGDLEVTGTIDTVSQTNTEIVDKTITINKGGANLASGDQAGIVVDTGTTLKPAIKWADDNMGANATDIPGCGWYIDQLCETPSASNRVYLAGMKVSNSTPGTATKAEGEGMFYYEKDSGDLYICTNSFTSGGSN